MESKERARRAKEALGLIEQGLGWLEEAAFADPSEDGDDLFWAYQRYSEAWFKALEQDEWDWQNNHTPSPLKAIRSAIKALLA